VNSATSALIFFIGKRLLNSTVGIAAAGQLCTSFSQPHQCSGWPGMQLILSCYPCSAAAFLLLNQQNQLGRGRLFLSGLLMGLGFSHEATRIIFSSSLARFIFSCRCSRRFSPYQKPFCENLVFIGGAVIPLVITFLALCYAGVFAKFWFWNNPLCARVRNSRFDLGCASAPYSRRQRRDRTKPGHSGYWLESGCSPALLNRPTRRSTGFLVGLLIASILALCPGFYFRSHYF